VAYNYIFGVEIIEIQRVHGAAINKWKKKYFLNIRSTKKMIIIQKEN